MRSCSALSLALLLAAGPAALSLGAQESSRVETSEFTGFTFTKDFSPGTRDENGQYLSGSEIMRLTSHRGNLFAATSMFRDPWMSERYPGYTGAQVLRKRSSDAAWEADVSFGTRFLRVDSLESVQFTHDSLGQPLPEPAAMLVAGIWDLGPNASGRDRWISVAIRNDETGSWTISRIAPVPDSDRGFASVRAMTVHRDRRTGRQYLFVGAANGGMFKGVFDPAAEGRIRWLGSDEVDSTYGRPQSMTVCNSALYASFDYGGITVQQQTGGIFRRADGETPRWEPVYRNYNPEYVRWNQTARGITCVPLQDGSGEEVILTALESIPEPVVIRIEPSNNHRAFVEVNYLDLFTSIFNVAPKADESGLVTAALNYLEPFENPDSGTVDRFLTTNIRHPRDPAAGNNGAYFLIRRSASRYDWVEIQPAPDLAAGSTLRGVRSIEKSPFPDEPHVYYFGGYTAGIVEPMQSNTAWIYKGTLTPPHSGGVEIVTTTDIRYTTISGVNPNLLSLDFYAPKGAQKAPVVLYVHGGSWNAGDKRVVAHLPEFFAGAGWVLGSVNYRLAPQAQHPAMVQDVAAAVAWVHDNIALYGGIRNRST